MNLILALTARLASEPSYFRQHLLREDLARLEKLTALASAHDDASAFLAAGAKLGWTPEDRRTHELKPALDPLLLAIHQRARIAPDVDEAIALDDRIALLWEAFEQLRMDRLVGCLSRVPRPDDVRPS